MSARRPTARELIAELIDPANRAGSVVSAFGCVLLGVAAAVLYGPIAGPVVGFLALLLGMAAFAETRWSRRHDVDD